MERLFLQTVIFHYQLTKDIWEKIIMWSNHAAWSMPYNFQHFERIDRCSNRVYDIGRQQRSICFPLKIFNSTYNAKIRITELYIDCCFERGGLIETETNFHLWFQVFYLKLNFITCRPGRKRENFNVITLDSPRDGIFWEFPFSITATPVYRLSVRILWPQSIWDIQYRGPNYGLRSKTYVL